MQAQRPEYEGNKRAHGVEHVALVGEAFSDPVADRAALGHPAADVGERAAADERVVDVAEHEKRV
jgi:hypothetical protein